MVTCTAAVLQLCSTFPGRGAGLYSTRMSLGTLEAEFEFDEPLPPLCRRYILFAAVGPVLSRLAKGTVWYGGLCVIVSGDHSCLSVLRGAFCPVAILLSVSPSFLVPTVFGPGDPASIAVIDVLLVPCAFSQYLE